MTPHHQHHDQQPTEQPPAPAGKPSPPPARHQLALQAAETVRQIVEEEPR